MQVAARRTQKETNVLIIDAFALGTTVSPPNELMSAKRESDKENEKEREKHL